MAGALNRWQDAERRGTTVGFGRGLPSCVVSAESMWLAGLIPCRPLGTTENSTATSTASHLLYGST